MDQKKSLGRQKFDKKCWVGRVTLTTYTFLFGLTRNCFKEPTKLIFTLPMTKNQFEPFFKPGKFFRGMYEC